MSPIGTKQTASSANGGRTRLGQQRENEEQPETDCGYSCSHIGPSSSPQDLLNSGYLLIALNNTRSTIILAPSYWH
jgi:hypothetical protein